MAVSSRDMSRCLARLKNADPQVYELFTNLLKNYASELTVAVTTCPQAEMMECRGRAQQAMKFLQMFTELPTS